MEHTLHDLEYERVLSLFFPFALSDEGREHLRTLPFSRDLQEIGLTQRMIGEIRSISARHSEKPERFVTLSEVDRHQQLGSFSLKGEHLYVIKEYLNSARAFVSFLRHHDSDPHQQDHENNLVSEVITSYSDTLERYRRELETAIESPGIVKMSHPAIAPLVKKLEGKKRERGTYATGFLREHESSAQSLTPSYRDNRVVLPIRNDHKREVDGLLHSSSQSGQTLYVEPYTLVSYNNAVVQASQEIEREIARILRELSDTYRSLIHEFDALRQEIGLADSLYARAMAMDPYQLVFPLVSGDLELNIVAARHPLLGREAIPISLEMTSPVRSLLLSGPNAGGKTVSIKTIGLLALMHQHLAVVPSREGTTLPLFSRVFTDIGDEQSIEKSLSTFSARMQNIGSVLNSIDDHALVILDELGSGTDPEEGSAIGKSILEYCISRGGITLVTSHHTALKQFAYAREELINASMEFDETTHTPTFRIISGLPGDSHAIDTARRMSLPVEVINKAESYLGEQNLKASEIIRRLEEKEREEERRLKDMEEKEKTIREKIRALDLHELSLRQKEILLRQEQIGSLSSFISQKRAELENLVAELRTGEITREKTRKMKNFLDTLDEKKEESTRHVQKMKQTLAPPELELRVGMDILVGENRRPGTIVRFEKSQKVQVSVNGMKFTVDAGEITPAPQGAQKKQPAAKKASLSYQVDTHAAMTLDVRGKTLNEAIEIVDSQIERALLSGVLSFSIIHGLGTGVLMKGIGDHLASLPFVRHFEFARPEDGGHGKTYVELGA